MKAIIITGSPGTGKTTIAKKLAKSLKIKYLDVNTIIKDYKLSEGIDKVRNCDIVDTAKLNKVLVSLINEPVIIDSHLSHYLPKKYVSICLVTKCELPILKKRLQKRGYSEAKVRENLDAEIFDICATEAAEAGHQVEVVETNKPIDIINLGKSLKRYLD